MTASPTLQAHADHKAKTQTWDKLYANPDMALANQRLETERGRRRWQTYSAYLDRQYPGQTLSAVELGAGGGDLSILLAQAGHKVTLVDFSPEALGHARQRFESLGLEAQFIQADVFEFMQTHAGRFDLSGSLGVAEHFSGQKRNDIIGAHQSVLRVGGTAFISVPNARCLPYRLWKLYLEARGCWPYGYEAPFSPRSLARFAKRNGLAPCHVYQTGFTASIDGCLLLPITGKRRGWQDGPKLLNLLGGWEANLIALREG